jgi:hypothetical protein
MILMVVSLRSENAEGGVSSWGFEVEYQGGVGIELSASHNQNGHTVVAVILALFMSRAQFLEVN